MRVSSSRSQRGEEKRGEERRGASLVNMCGYFLSLTGKQVKRTAGAVFIPVLFCLMQHLECSLFSRNVCGVSFTFSKCLEGVSLFIYV